MSIGQTVDEGLLGRLPLPLAQLYRRARNAKTALERHQAAYYLWEASLKLLGSVTVVEYTALGSQDPDLKERLKNLARPSLGHWWEFVRKLLPALAESKAAEEPFVKARDLVLGRMRDDLPRAAGLDAMLREVLDSSPGSRSTVRLSELFERLVRYRNQELGHGAAGQRPGDFYDRMGGVLLAGVSEILGRLDVLLGRRLIHVAEVRRQVSGRWLLERYELLGESARRIESLDLPETEALDLPRPGRTYLEPPASPAGTGALRSLHPLVLFDPDAGEFFFLNARRGESRARYLSYSSGRAVDREELRADRLELLSTVLGGSVDPGQAEAWAARSQAEDAPAAAPEPGPPRRSIGEFEILSRIGRGGMGVVYRAWQPSLGRQVALKCLLGAGDPKVEARFAREIRSLGRVEHPNLVKIFTSGSDGEQWFYAMELIEGADLSSVLDHLAGSAASEVGETEWKRAVSTACLEARQREESVRGDSGPATKPPSSAAPSHEEAASATTFPGAARARGSQGYIAQIVGIVRQAAEAAHALHEAGVVHRDIKPGNIILAADGAHAILMDLGLAQLADEADGRLTRTRQFVGTLRYASPEQVLAAGTLDRRSDVYSLGATLWELLTLRPIFGAGDDTPTPELMRKIQSEEAGSPRRHNPRVAPDLEAIVLKCLEKNPARRYATARDLASDLDRWERGDPVVARPQTLRYLLGKFVRRYRLRLAAAAAVVLLLLAVAVVSAVRVHRAHRASLLSVFDLYTSTGLAASEDHDYTQALLWFAAAGDVPHGDPAREEANRRRLESWIEEAPRTVRALPHPGQRIREILFQPAGARLLTIADGDRATLWDIESEEPEPLPGGERPVAAAAWSPRGSRLALGRPDGSVELFRFPEGDAVASPPAMTGRVRALAFSGDGRRLAVGADGARIWDCERDRWEGEPLPHPEPVAWLAFDEGGGRLLTSALDDRARLFAVSPEAPARLLLEPLPHFVGFVNIPGLAYSSVPWRPALIDGGRGLLTITTPTEVTWWDARTGARKRSIPAEERVAAVAPSPDGRWLAIADFLKVQVWDVSLERPVGEALTPTAGSYEPPTPLTSWSPDGSCLLVSSADLFVRAWRAPYRNQTAFSSFQSRLVSKLHHVLQAKCLAWSPGGELAATAQSDGLVRVWRLGTDLWPPRALPVPWLPARECSIRQDGRFLLLNAATSLRPLACPWVVDLKNGRAAGPALRVTGELEGGSFSPDGDRVHTFSAALPKDGGSKAGGGPEGPGHLIEFWDWKAGKRLWSAATEGRPKDYIYTSDGRELIVSCSGGEILTIETATGAILHRARAKEPHAALAFRPGGEEYAAWNRGESPRFLRADTGEELRGGLVRPVPCADLAFSEDGTLLVTVDVDGTVEVWDAESGCSLSPPLRHTARIEGLAISGDRLLTGCGDGRVRIWEWRTARLACAPLEHRFGLTAAAFVGPGEGQVATASWADGLQLWDVASGKLLQPSRPVVDLNNAHFTGSKLRTDLHVLSIEDPASAGLGLPSDEEWTRLAEVLSARTVHEGGTVLLSSEEWLARWQELRRERPDLVALGLGPGAEASWHRRRAEALEREWRWDAALWHLDRLGRAMDAEDRRRLDLIRSHVRTWRFAPEPLPWKGAGSRVLDPVTSEELGTIVAGAQASPPLRAVGPRVDFIARYPDQASLTRGYILRTIRAEAPRKVRVLAGSDDTLRAWLDSREVFASPDLGPAVLDYHRFDLDLAAGENVLLVEVGQSGGDWALYFRLQDPDGRWLALDDEGNLERLEEGAGDR